MDTLNKTLQTIVAIIGAAIALFIPGISSGDQLLDALISFTAFAPFVMIIAAALNTWLEWEDMKAFLLTGLIAVVTGYLSYFLNIGFLAEATSLWWHPIITGIGIFAMASLGFNVSHVKFVLELIFDYSWKQKNVQH